jgi:hypothetical protein
MATSRFLTDLSLRESGVAAYVIRRGSGIWSWDGGCRSGRDLHDTPLTQAGAEGLRPSGGP